MFSEINLRLDVKVSFHQDIRKFHFQKYKKKLKKKKKHFRKIISENLEQKKKKIPIPKKKKKKKKKKKSISENLSGKIEGSSKKVHQVTIK